MSLRESGAIINSDIKTSIMTYSLVFVVLFFSSSIVVLPHIFAGFPLGHSVLWNTPWQQCFSEQLLSGEIYPRWLFNYLDGFGAPVFYFYAPIPFYLLAFIDVTLGKGDGGFTIFTTGSIVMCFLSSVAFFIFMSRWVDKYWSIVTSILYVFLPYHYIDLEVRAALGESFAYVWIPLIMIGLCSPRKIWSHLFFSGFCYAGLILSHLPSAMLVAPAIAIFSVCASKQSQWLHSVGRAFFVGIVGVALSAFYILPAILLRDTLTYDAWVTGSGRHFLAVNWLLGSSGIPPFGLRVYMALAVTSLVGVGAAFSFGVISFLKKRKVRGEEIIWRLITASLVSLLVCWLLMTVVSRPIWEYFPFISQVQFPWRLGIVIDFCSMLLVGLSTPRILEYVLRLTKVKSRTIVAITHCVIAAVALATLVVYFPQVTIDSREELGAEANPLEYRTKWLVESSIYLPKKNVIDLTNIDLAPRIHSDGIDRWKAFVSHLPPISPLREPEYNEIMSLNETRETIIRISAVLNSPATIRIKKIYFPHWELKNSLGEDINIYPDAQTGLSLFDLPPGKHQLTLDRHLLPSEQLGFVISLVSLAVSLVWVITSSRRAS